MVRKNIKNIFLDRDGVINVDTGYISDFNKIKFIPDTIKTLKKFTSKGINLFVVTNQSGLARGYFDCQQYNLLNFEILKALRGNGINISDVFTCPHHPEGLITKYKKKCECRKPKPGLILMACEKYNLDVRQSILIGDKPSDIKAGKAAGITDCYLLQNNNDNNKRLNKTKNTISSLKQLLI